MSRSALHDLALRIQSTDPKNRTALLGHLERLCDVSGFVRQEDPRMCGALLLAAGHAMQALAADEGGNLDRRQTHAIVCGLLQVVEKALAQRAAARASGAERLRASQEATQRSAVGTQAPVANGKAGPPRRSVPLKDPEESRPVDYVVTRDMFFGEVLLGAGMITTEEFAAAMEIHRRKGIHLGEALVELGCLTQEEVEGGLFLQQQLRRAAEVKAPKR